MQILFVKVFAQEIYNSVALSYFKFLSDSDLADNTHFVLQSGDYTVLFCFFFDHFLSDMALSKYYLINFQSSK